MPGLGFFDAILGWMEYVLVGDPISAMGTHVSFIFRDYNPDIEGSKPSFFHGFLGSKGVHTSLDVPGS